MHALHRVDYKNLRLGKEELCSLEYNELVMVAKDIFDRIERRAKFMIVCFSVIPIIGWVGLVFSLSKDYDGSANIAYWHAYKKLASKGDKAIELAFKYMKGHNFDPGNWNISDL